MVLNILVMTAVLVMPAMARATPCLDAGSKAKMPCPHMAATQKADTGPDHSGMMMSECVDLENTLSQADSALVKADTFQADFIVWSNESLPANVIATAQTARAPPNVAPLPQQHPLLTTQRIRR